MFGMIIFHMGQINGGFKWENASIEMQSLCQD